MASTRSDKQAAKAQQRAEKEKRKKAKGPGTFAQMKQVFEMTKKSDPNIVWYMLLGALVTMLVFILIGVLTGNWITWTIIGIPFAVLVAILILSRRAERAAFGQIEGQPGAAGAAMSSLRRGWIVEQQPVQMNARSQAMVFRALGRPGVVLVTEGPRNSVGALISQEKKRLKRVVPSVPVHVINSGNDEGQTPLKQITKEMNKLPKSLTQQEVHQVNNRISTLGNNMLGVPKGIDPTRMRPDRKAMRGR
ncbi:DUF4191 domain-containing protein [Rothia aerolata]|uniref:DUF4191 domain-containing protein n=1 Tax=Rothia aerolata TaxID=1812262 RepID=A0A917IL90_9MICC|nr:DUF4191 domain-containing protein [Rothia aerolata]GGH56612.1 hypothetical protein GCM10007359_00880 [Rothia aerolata]